MRAMLNPLNLDLRHVRAAIIDLDGTLIDTQGDFVAVLNSVLAELSLPCITPAFVQRTVGKGSEHLIHSVLQEVGAPPALFASAWPLYQARYLALNGAHSSVYPGVLEGLTQLAQRGWAMACVTNKPSAFVMPLLRLKGLDSFFSVVFGGDAFERKKPDPMPLLQACLALNTPPARTLMVGDSSNDAQAARAAGCPVVLVRYGYNHGEPVSAVGADGLIDRLDEL
jgi:phosphoglycolate phosphatase